MRKNKKKAQAQAVEENILFNEERVNNIISSSNPKEEFEKLLINKDVAITIAQYLKANYVLNKDFETLLKKYYFKDYVNALKGNLSFFNEERFSFLVEVMEYKISEIIGEYFQKCQDSPNKSFERIVAKKLPDVFIQNIRSHKAFMYDKRLKFYNDEKDVLQIPVEHLETWNVLKENENCLWSKVEKLYEKFIIENSSHSTPSERLCSAMVEIIVWMEEKRWCTEDCFSTPEQRMSNRHRACSRHKLSQKNTINNDCSVLQRPMFFVSRLESTETLNRLLECYSLFVEKYIRDNKICVLNIDEKIIKNLFDKQFYSTLEKGISQTSQELFEAIFSWNSFYNGILSTYCYNTNVKPIIRQNGDLYLSESPKEYYRWKLDGCRYNINRKIYIELGKDCMKDASSLLINNLCLDEINWNDEKISTNPAFKLITELSIQKHRAYEKTIDFIKRIKSLNNTKTWKEAYKKYCLEQLKTNESILPFFLFTKNSLNQLVKTDDIQEDTLNITTKLFDRLCFKFDDEIFNRLKKRSYNAMNKPFLEICHNIYFLPTMFFANNDWFYNCAEIVIEMYDQINEQYRKNSTSRMEIFLSNLFEKHGWIVNCNHDGDKKRKGDVDIIVKDKDTVLLIQLKRTKFRSNPSEQYLEIENTDKKAVYQLNYYEYKGNEKNIVRWYVTNSYENCLKEYVDEKSKTSCTKVNYFDIILVLGLSDIIQKILDNPSEIYPPLNNENLDEIRQLKIELETLDGIINYITNDSLMHGHSNMKDAFLNKNLSYLFNGTLFPTITEPCKAYEIPLKTNNTKTLEKLNSILDKSKMNIEDRLIIAEELSHIIPDDYRVWDILADIYTDKEEFHKAIDCCKKSLELLPQDPFLIRNYIMTLYKEKHSHKPFVFHPSEEEKEAAKTLLDEYWFLDIELPFDYLYLIKNQQS